jgi:DET1- and DDB1-associated protein 1
MMDELLKQLPCRNRNNFAHFQADAANKISHKKAAVYLPTNDEADCPNQQGECISCELSVSITDVHVFAVITTEKTNILLRYLHQQWDKKRERVNAKRRESASDSETCTKKMRVRSGRDDADH